MPQRQIKQEILYRIRLRDQPDTALALFNSSPLHFAAKIRPLVLPATLNKCLKKILIAICRKGNGIHLQSFRSFSQALGSLINLISIPLLVIPSSDSATAFDRFHNPVRSCHDSADWFTFGKHTNGSITYLPAWRTSCLTSSGKPLTTLYALEWVRWKLYCSPRVEIDILHDLIPLAAIRPCQRGG